MSNRLFAQKPGGDVYGRTMRATHGLQIVLVRPEIPPNTGNISRLCAATGASLHLVHPLGFKTDESSLKRAGLDYWAYLDVHEHESWEAFLAAHPQALSGAHPKGWLTATRVGKPYTAISYQPGDYLIFGSESVGLPKDLIEQHRERCTTIPILGMVRSLNLANSVAIILYEAIRQLQPQFFSGDDPNGVAE
jgi:tRNA (cytidine/uridine-2'-O-)-methyltransferase